MAQNNLGTALGRLGERETGTERLVQALEAISVMRSLVVNEARMERYAADFDGRIGEIEALILKRQ